MAQSQKQEKRLEFAPNLLGLAAIAKEVVWFYKLGEGTRNEFGLAGFHLSDDLVGRFHDFRDGAKDLKGRDEAGMNPPESDFRKVIGAGKVLRDDMRKVLLAFIGGSPKFFAGRLDYIQRHAPEAWADYADAAVAKLDELREALESREGPREADKVRASEGTLVELYRQMGEEIARLQGAADEEVKDAKRAKKHSRAGQAVEDAFADL